MAPQNPEAAPEKEDFFKSGPLTDEQKRVQRDMMEVQMRAAGLEPVKNRHLTITVGFEAIARICERLEDEGHTVVSVASVMVPTAPQALTQFATIYATIPRSASETAYEKEIREASSRLIKPVGLH